MGWTFRTRRLLLMAAGSMLIPTFTHAGDPGCPPGCTIECSLIVHPTTVNNATCLEVSAVWTRLRDGCRKPDCSDCRTCKGRLRVTVNASAPCAWSLGGGFAVDWDTYFELSGSGNPQGTGSGSAGLVLQPDGSYSYVDPRDLEVDCGYTASYEGKISSGSTVLASISAAYSCDACAQ